MVNRLQQTIFSAGDFDSSRLNWHTRPGRFSNRLVIFIHGLGGKGYGTWKQFPAVMFNAHSIDVAFFDYVSFIRRIRGGGTRVETYVEMLADRIRELEKNYESIYLIGHSLGGVIAESAVMKYLIYKRVDTSNQLTSICGIILLASPRAGAALALPIVRNLFPEGEWLRRGSDANSRTDSYFSTRIESDVTADISYVTHSRTPPKIFIPRYVCLGAGDRLVDPFSADHSIPMHQRHLIAANHRSIIDVAEVAWVNTKIAEIETRRQEIREHLQASNRRRQITAPRANIVVTEFWASGADVGKWERVYNEVRDSASFPDPEVHDSRDIPGTEVSLLISLTDSGLVMSDSANQKATISRAVARKETDYALTIGLSAVGEKSADATRIIEQWLYEQGRPPHISVNEAADAESLRSVIYTWIYNVVYRHPRSGKLRTYQIERQIQADLSSIDPAIGD